MAGGGPRAATTRCCRNLFQRAVLLRLATVLATVLVATYLAHDWGGLMSYRVGEVRASDLRARVFFEVVDEEETARKRDEAVQDLSLEQQRDRNLCDEVRRKVPLVMKKFPPGTLLVERNFPISDSQYELLQAESRAFWASQSEARRLCREYCHLSCLHLVGPARRSVRGSLSRRAGLQPAQGRRRLCRGAADPASWACSCATKSVGTWSSSP